MTKKIVVLGAGPAGGAVALGLKRLGYAVQVVGEPRPFSAVEGISDRVVEGLRYAGFNRVIANLPEPSARNAVWNGEHNSANTERLIDRQQVDQLIIEDLRAAGIKVIEAKVSKVLEQAQDGDANKDADVDTGRADGFVIRLADGKEMNADFLVEARGRAAPSAHLPRVRGPETLSLLQYWQGPETERGSAAVSLPDGWAWMAKTESGKRYLQLTLDVGANKSSNSVNVSDSNAVASNGDGNNGSGSHKLPGKDQLADYCRQRFEQISEAAEFMVDAEPVGIPHGRTSTPILCEQTVGSNWLRVGDAAMAVDPLSGNGVFQALSSALQAPAVINTLLKYPERKALAEQFYQQRVSGLFYRFARIGRDFYAMEQQWTDHPFWQQRNQWPDAEPMHQTVSFDQLKVKAMPVVNDGVIDEQEVVVTPDQPLGIWHLAGIPLAGVVQAVQQREPEQTLEECLLSLSLDENQRMMLLRWLQSMGC